MFESTGDSSESRALAHAAELFKKLAGPAFEEFGAMLGDSARVYRVKNLIRTTEKTRRILADAELPPSAIPGRILLPLIDACAVEDDDFLQEQWAGLMASATQGTDDLRRSFVDTLKQLTPAEAQHLKRIFHELTKLYKREPKRGDVVPYQAFQSAWAAPECADDTFRRLGLVQRDYTVKLQQPNTFSVTYTPEGEDVSSALSNIEDAIDELEAGVMFQYVLTAYAVAFVKACEGPIGAG